MAGGRWLSTRILNYEEEFYEISGTGELSDYLSAQ